MNIVRIATNFNIDIDFTTPPFHTRFIAWFIDCIVQIFYIVIALRLYYWINDKVGYSRDASYTMWAVGLLLVLPFLLYHLAVEVLMNGQSIGKKLMHLKVVSESGGRASVSQFLIRWLIRTSDYTIFMLILMLPYAAYYGPVIYWGMAGAMGLVIVDLVLVNSGKQQRLGDILAHTLVINTRQRETINDTIFLEVGDSYKPSFPQVMDLTDKDINTLKSILDRARRHKDFALAAMAAEKIKSHLRIDSNMEPVHFLEKLLHDYNYLSSH